MSRVRRECLPTKHKPRTLCRGHHLHQTAELPPAAPEALPWAAITLPCMLWILQDKTGN